jgi:hypothetical protein
MTEPMNEAMLAELVASHATQRLQLAALQSQQSLVQELSELKSQLSTMRAKQERMDVFLAKHYARSDTDLGAAARATFGDAVADSVAHRGGARELLGTAHKPINTGGVCFPAWSVGHPSGTWVAMREITLDSCCGMRLGRHTDVTKDLSLVTCEACRDVIKSHPLAPAGFDPWSKP